MGYVKTPKGVIGKAYNRMRRAIEKEDCSIFSKLEFRNDTWKNDLFWTLYDEYKDEQYDQQLLPVIERIDIEKPFSLDNIHWVTQQNACIYSRPKVLVTDKDGNAFTFNSAFEAERELKLPQGVISRVVRTKKGRYKQWQISTSKE